MFNLSNINFKQTENTHRLVIPAVIGTILLGAIAFASIPSAGGVIYGCFKKAGGSLRVIDSSTTQCSANEVQISWNQTGPQGIAGPQGPQGPQGPAGSLTGPAGGALDGMYPNPGIADGAVTSADIANQTINTVDLANGAVSAPKLLGGSAATNVWGNNQWAPVNATFRGYVHIDRDNIGHIEESGGYESISFPVPIAPGDYVIHHAIKRGDPVPEGCGGSFDEPYAEPGNLCVFYDSSSVIPGKVVLVGGNNRYGQLLRIDQVDYDPCYCGISADVVWAMKPSL